MTLGVLPAAAAFCPGDALPSMHLSTCAGPRFHNSDPGILQVINCGMKLLVDEVIVDRGRDFEIAMCTHKRRF